MKAESEQILIELLEDFKDSSKKKELLDQLKDDKEALEAYQLMIDADKFIGDLPAEEPSSNFSNNILVGYKRIKTREKNNRLISYFLGIVVAAVVVVLSLAGDASTSIPTNTTPLLDQISNWIPNWSVDLKLDQMIQLILVLNAILLIVVIEKIISKKRMPNIFSL